MDEHLIRLLDMLRSKRSRDNMTQTEALDLIAAVTDLHDRASAHAHPPSPPMAPTQARTEERALELLVLDDARRDVIAARAVVDAAWEAVSPSHKTLRAMGMTLAEVIRENETDRAELRTKLDRLVARYKACIPYLRSVMAFMNPPKAAPCRCESASDDAASHDVGCPNGLYGSL
jgi:hypothetical protein